jgi:hypothetical protein
MRDGTISIPEKFRGPPKSANGGYATGAFAALLEPGFGSGQGDPVEVTLRAPVPLDRELAYALHGDVLVVRDGETLIAEARRAELDLEVPAPASWERALSVRDRSAALIVGKHPWLGEKRVGFHPICFCCGAELTPELGLRVFAAPVPDLAQVAAAWIGEPAYAAPSGELPPEIVCTALDCPGQFAWLAEGTRTGLLGRLTVRIDRPVRAGEPCVVIGWTLGNEGKKFYAGTALFDASGALCACAKAVWIGKF